MRRSSIVGEGIVVGLVGAAAVAIWFLIADLAAGVPFRTSALLDAALLHGLRDPGALQVTARVVAEYTVVHGLAFIAFGIAAAGLFALVDHDRRVLFAVFMLFCCFEVFFAALVTILSERLLEEITVMTILGANLLAAIAMLGILFRRHHRAPSELFAVEE